MRLICALRRSRHRCGRVIRRRAPTGLSGRRRQTTSSTAERERHAPSPSCLMILAAAGELRRGSGRLTREGAKRHARPAPSALSVHPPGAERGGGWAGSPPRLVQQVLDLVDFPTIVWFETDSTTRQVSGRSRRIGQTQPVQVVFGAYWNSVPADAVNIARNVFHLVVDTRGRCCCTNSCPLCPVRPGIQSPYLVNAGCRLRENDESGAIARLCNSLSRLLKNRLPGV